MGRLIAFLTDLGYADDAVGMCKGLMLQRSPGSQIVDISHEVRPFAVAEASLYLSDLPDFFPDDTVFTMIIIPETGVLPCVAARNERGQIFVAADNGVLTGVRRREPFEAIYQIDNPECMVYPPTPSFYGRDVVVACAGSLAGGFPLEKVGKRIDDVRMLPQEDPHVDGDGTLVGSVSIIDRNFGNIWTDIPGGLCEKAELAFGDQVLVEFDGQDALDLPYRQTFGMVEQGAALAYLNSRGRLAFARNQGSLQEVLQVPSGTRVRVRQAG
ncbi:SAM hydrolase/SAM-dependent halogenase family protein [Actinoplanes sp. URMC 104]|uniref:SAM hydrolase/SAM-dependent halogenase family protein n=1 Tax=Actinoplanes sp. URMC 104 TaxID=3423409 RepID=UPI003F1CBD21